MPAKTRPAKPRAAAEPDRPPTAAEDTPRDERAPADRSPASTRGVPAPRVKRSTAARRVAAAAHDATSLEARHRLRSLAELVRQGAGDAQRAEFIEASLADCLDEAAAAAPADRWLTCEAATWALAWMARARRAGGSAGGLLERLVGAARAAEPLMAGGDTLPARFVLTLARLFRDIEACRRLEPGASGAVSGEIARLVSPGGVVNVAGGSAMVDRVVRWTGFRAVALATGEPPWDEATEGRWREAAGVAARLLGRRGRRIVAAGLMPSRSTAPLLEALAALGGRQRRTVAALRKSRAPGRGQLLRRDLHDDAAAVAILRSGWGSDDLRVLIDYRQPVPHLEIAVGDRLLVDGPWGWSIAAAGTPLDAEGPWTVECWESDRRASLIELAAPLGGGRRLERQVVMLPQERVVLLADAVTTPGQPPLTSPAVNGQASAPHLQYAATLRLAPGLDADPAAETREVMVFDTTMRMQALPLALPEWRVGRGGRLDATPDGLSLAQETAGPRLYAPLWLDCTPARIGRPLTWRQLTVADTRLNLPAWQAAGFRVQSGLEQWLVYRSLDAPRNRTLLGCNVSCDFVIGRIRPHGDVKRMLEIQ